MEAAGQTILALWKRSATTASIPSKATPASRWLDGPMPGMTYARTNYGPQKKATSSKTIDQLAREVLDRKWGNGAERKQRLTQAGHNYQEVQKAVNKYVTNPNYSLAREVLAGKWENGAERIKRLMNAGHNSKDRQSNVKCLNLAGLY